MAVLLDSNVLIALIVEDHVHHQGAENWFKNSHEKFATCPITQGSLIRFLIREGQESAIASDVLTSICSNPRHEFWKDEIEFTEFDLKPISGHRQVADFYLANLARSKCGKLVTFDVGMYGYHKDVVELITELKLN